MKTAKTTIAIVGALAGISLAIATLPGGKPAVTPSDGKAAKDPAMLAMDTLEQQLQRRFHDRNNVSFGYERVVRIGSRMHGTPAMDIIKNRGVPLRDDGTPMPNRRMGDSWQYEVVPGKWVYAQDIKQTMHSENDAEKQALATLAGRDVSIYTAGIFDPETGQPARMKGPAYLSQTANTAPLKDSLSDLAAKGWASKNDVSEFGKDGWIYRVVKVKADDQTCIGCHQSNFPYQHDGKKIKPTYQLGNPIGVFIVGMKK